MAADQTTNSGRRPEKALSAAFVRQVSKPGKYFDGHGLYLRVQPNGARQWVQRIVIRRVTDTHPATGLLHVAAC
jgi:hypothetical protein